jgi:plasmid maintenance system antidote protein VapI
VIDANLVTFDYRGMSTSQDKLKDKLLTPGLRSEMHADRIGQRLALLREALGLIPAEISQRLDIPPTYWSRFESGKRPLTETIAAALVERYGVTLDFLILGKWDKLPSDLADRMRNIKQSREIN